MTERKHKFPAENCQKAGSVLEAAVLKGVKNGTVSDTSARQMLEVARWLFDKCREEEGLRGFSEDEKNTIAFALSDACAPYAADPQGEARHLTILELAKKFQGNGEETKT